MLLRAMMDLVAILNGVDGLTAVLKELNKNDSDGKVTNVLVNGEKITKLVKSELTLPIFNNVTRSTTFNKITLSETKKASKSLKTLTTETNNTDGMFTTVEESMMACTLSVELLMS